jgi:hypothetical protein
MDAISLIVRGDHFGLCHAVNQALWESFEAGVLTCASLTVTGPWVAEAAALAHDHPEWEIGLLLNLTCNTAGCRWGPIVGAAGVPSLVEPTGTFAAALSATASAEDIDRELDAQVERTRAWGLTPAFLEYEGPANQHVEVALHRLSERFGIPGRMKDWGLRSLLNAGGEGPYRDVRAALSTLEPGVHLWVVCPAQAAPETWALWPEGERIRRQVDANASCDPEIVALLRKRGIELISFRQHVESRLGAAAEQE